MISDASQQEQMRQTLEFLSFAATRFATAKEVTSLARGLHEIVNRLLDVPIIGMFFIDPQSGELTLPIAVGFSPQEQQEALRTAWDRHPGWVIRNGQSLHVPDVEADPERRTRDSQRSFVVRARLWMPILNEEKGVGAIGLASPQPHAFSDWHVAVIGFACHIAGVMYKNIVDNLELVRQLERVREQEQALRLLSSPVIEIWRRVLALPLIGYIDAQRSTLIAESLLRAVVEKRARAVILDLTGAQTLDAEATGRLLRLCSAIALLGSQCLLSGVSPEMARGLVEVNAELGALKTFATLQQALASAMAIHE
jgi:anti-anti-sigma regulatory factor